MTILSTSRRLVAIAVLLAGWPAAAAAPRFFSDDPLPREPESRSASGAKAVDIGLLYEMSYNLFVTGRKTATNVRAKNVNTIDEVPDSGWFTNRTAAQRRPPLDDLVRGPNAGVRALKPGPRWTDRAREERRRLAGIFTAEGRQRRETWFPVAFDTPGWNEGASGAMVVASKIFYALAATTRSRPSSPRVDPARMTIDPKATMRRPNGKRTPMRQDDVNAVLEALRASAC